MTKAELIKIISKKAAVADSSAKEFFDLFLQRIASELQPGESAQFSNVGYFCLRKGIIKKELAESENQSSQYLNLIIFSQSEEFNFKSPDNLVFSVSESKTVERDSIDSHFSLSVGKPVLPNLENEDAHYTVAHSPEELEMLLKRKIENLIINFNKIQGRKLESETLLVDSKTIYEDQLELELDDKVREKNSEPESDNVLHSSDELKSIAWGFGKDLSKKMFDGSASSKRKNENNAQTKPQFTSWDFGERYWDSTPASDKKNDDESDINNNTSATQTPSEDETKIKLPKKRKDEIKFREINMNDFLVSEGDEKIGNFERVRSISSTVGPKDPIKEVRNFEELPGDNADSDVNVVNYDDEFKKISSKAEKFRAADKKKSQEETTDSDTKVESKESIKLNRSEALRKQRKYSRKSSGLKFLAVAGIIIVIVVVAYFILKSIEKTEEVKEIAQIDERSDNTTYIERSYEIPVSYPYSKSENETKIVGLRSDSEVKSETIATTEKTELNIPPEKTVKKEEKPIIKKTEEKLIIKGSEEKPAGSPQQAAYNIYKYGNVFVVQVAAFRSKSVAEKEKQKYINRGNNSFIEQADVQGITWYRVRVGNFSTLEKAKQFRKDN